MNANRIPTYLILACSTLAAIETVGAVGATELHGNVKQQLTGTLSTGSGTLGGGFLQGGIKDEERLRPSLRVIPQPISNPQPAMDVGLTQYAGSVRSGPPLAPARAPSFPFGLNNTVHTISPISTVTPRSGVMSWAPGYEVTPVSQPIYGTTPTTAPQISTRPRSGVTTWAPGYEVTPVMPPLPAPIPSASAPSASGPFPSGPSLSGPSTMRSGVMSWVPGYEVTPINEPVIATSAIVQPNRSQGNAITPSNGIVSWVPGFEVRSVPFSSQFTYQSLKETLGGLWTTSTPVPADASALQGKLSQSKASGLVAQAKLLPGLHAIDKVISWDDWYNRVAHAIYERWENADTGPGTAHVRVVVRRYCDLSCRLTGFSAAPDVGQDLIKETEFREAAVRTVNLVDHSDVLEFPFMSSRDEVTFDVDLKRAVDGPARCEVVTSDKEIAHK